MKRPGISRRNVLAGAGAVFAGAAFSTRVMAYQRGNFYSKTWFEAVVGPFAPGVNIKAVVTVENNAGLITRYELPPTTVASNSAPQPKTNDSAGSKNSSYPAGRK